MVKPKLISESEVRISAINVRSAAIRVRWKDMPVRRIASSVRCSARVFAESLGMMAFSGNAIAAVKPTAYLEAAAEQEVQLTVAALGGAVAEVGGADRAVDGRDD